MALNIFSKSLLTLIMLVLIPTAILATSSRILIHYVKNDPIIIRQAIYDFSGIDVRYQNAELSTQLNHWKLKIDQLKVFQENFTFTADSIFLDLSLFPSFFKTGMSSFYAENAKVIISDEEGTSKSMSGQLELLNALSHWKSIIFTKLIITDEDEALTVQLDNLSYIKKDLASLTGEIDFKWENKNIHGQGLWIEAREDENSNWLFEMNVPSIFKDSSQITNNLGIQSFWHIKDNIWHVGLIGEIGWLEGEELQRLEVNARLNNDQVVIEDLRLGAFFTKGIEIKKSGSKVTVADQNIPIKQLQTVVAIFTTSTKGVVLDGVLNEIDVVFDSEKNSMDSLKLDMSDFSLELDNADFQSIASIDLQLEYANDAGEFRIQSENVNFVASALYSQPKYGQNLSGYGKLKRAANSSFDIELTKASFETLKGNKADMSLQLSGFPDNLNIFYELKLPIVSSDEAKDWLPDNNMNPVAYSWINQNLIKGDVKNFFFELKGTPESIASLKHKDHHLKIEGVLDQTIMTPLAGWEKIEIENADLIFFKNVLKVNASKGNLAGINIGQTKVILDTNTTKNRVLIDTNLEGNALVTDQYFRNSRLPAILGIEDFITNTQLKSGKVSVELKLGVRISDTDEKPTTVNGFVQFDETSVEMYNQRFVDGEGRIEFKNGRTMFSNLKALWHDHPITANLINSPIYTDGYRIQLSGIIEPNNWTSHVAGTSNFEGFIDIPVDHDKNSTLFQFNSSLEGVTSFLPLPFNKAKKDRMDFTLNASQSTENLQVDVKIGKELSGVKLIRRNGQTQFNKGAMWIGEKSKLSLREGSFLVDLTLPIVSTNRWFKFIEQFKKHRKSNTDSSGLEFPPIDQVKIKTNILRLSESNYDDVNAFAQLSNDTWTITLDSPAAKGTIDYDVETKYAVVNLEQFHLSNSQSSGEKKCLSYKKSDWNNIQVDVKQFKFGNQDLGHLTLTASQDHAHLVVPAFKISNSNFELTGDAQHNLYKSSTTLNFNYDGNKLLYLLRLVDLSENEVEAKEVRTSGMVSWVGSLFCPTFDKLHGKIEGNGKDGAIYSADPGFGRLLSLLNLRTLSRRFSFEWSDVTQPGMAFDEAVLNLDINEGRITLNEIAIKSTAANLNIEGSSNANNKTHDLRALVVPKYTDALVPLYLLFGGVTAGVGFGAIAANEVFNLSGGNEVLTEVYTIKGSWDKPDIKRE